MLRFIIREDFLLPQFVDLVVTSLPVTQRQTPRHVEEGSAAQPQTYKQTNNGPARNGYGDLRPL
jgi:hypothetical protein